MAIEEFAYFIAENSPGKRAVEIGVGFQLSVALKLRELGYDVTVIDWNEKAVANARKAGLNAIRDDVFNPRLEIYRDADVIYSVRPTPEIVRPILRLGRTIKKPVYILPFSGDPIPPGTRLVNYRGLAIYATKGI
ncbi:MAG TPA: hypothetical protein ENH81_07120 [Thermococcus sp.]|nr:hypothetical protein [Thermococcus sp.]